MKQPRQYVFLFSTLCLIIAPSTAMASLGSVGDIQTLMERLSRVLPAFWGLLMTIAYVAGVGFILKGLLMLKAFSAPLTQQSRPGEIAGPLVYLFVGTMLLWIGPSTDAITKSIFGSSGVTIAKSSGGLSTEGYVSTQAAQALLSYAPASLESQWGHMFDTIILYVRFIGFMAFLRGWFIIAHAGQPGVQPGSVVKGIVHILGGILAINLVPLAQMIQNTISSG